MKPGQKPKGQVSTTWSPGLAYAIGLLTADGCLINDGRHIDFTSKDRELVQTFKDCLRLKVKTGTKKSSAGNTCYRAQFGDVLFYQFLMSIGLSPAKSKTISSVLIPEEHFSHFLRGYFDGDGTSSSFYDSVFPQSYRFYIGFTSASPQFVNWLREKIKKNLAIKGHIVRYKDKNYLQLKYAKHEAIILARYIYDKPCRFFLRRKYLKIQRSLNILKQPMPRW